MKMTAMEENAKTLAALLGIDEEEAAKKLDISVLITYDGSDATSQTLAGFTQQLLNRTVRSSKATICTVESPAVEIVIGNVDPCSSGPYVFVSVTEKAMSITKHPQRDSEIVDVHPVILLLAACYAAAVSIRTAVKEAQLTGSDTITIAYDELLGEHPSVLSEKVFVGEAYLAGAGAIGNGFLFALRYFNVHGRLHVVDPKRVRDGNLNRCAFFELSDIGTDKAPCLCRVAQPFFKNLDLVPHVKRLDAVEGRSSGPWLERLIVAVDSRRVRRNLQTEIPREVYDASTTDVREVVLHFSRQPTQGECLCCVYREEEQERNRETHVAESLGVAVKDVQSGFITEASAQQIHALYPDIQPSTIIGTAYDTLFKALCGQQALRTDEGRQVLAPFSFVSVLAGTYLAIETVLRLLRVEREKVFNYWRISPWSSPVLRLRQYRLARSDCEFCSREYAREVIRNLWKG